MVGRLHEGVQHLGQGHLVGQQPEESEEDDEENDGLETALCSEFQGLLEFFLNAFEDFFHPVVIEHGGSFDGVVFRFCHDELFFDECVKQVDLPSEAEVGLELAGTVYIGVRSTEGEAQAAVA